MMRVIKGATRDTLLIYMHREETSRLISGIKHVLVTRFCETDQRERLKLLDVTMTRNETHCVIDESPALFKMIKRRANEIGHSGPQILTCDLYDSIKENRPKMVFMNYKQANKLQDLIQKYHCPDVGHEVLNTAAVNAGSFDVYIRLANGEGAALLDTWLDAKRHVIEWILDMKKDSTCQGRTRNLEDILFACEDETISL
eukprot:CAMPEP_0172521692 /NCGR_PEP_ID=MMETSP1066-20121228/292727_1 /TAXON_ID=671091 /ORGANISM="Coscinodiscus wailesii, Strain CCMP2513" /LENGTH=199 /DNA_ID=CAMNT_0013304641 /DNA_START=654 /DNA_END=1253 /DNA_ORIENTATION=-